MPSLTLMGCTHAAYLCRAVGAAAGSAEDPPGLQAGDAAYDGCSRRGQGTVAGPDLPGPRHHRRRDQGVELPHLQRGGQGRLETAHLQVRVPAGVRNGQKIRLREFGAPGKNGGAPGDLYVTAHVTD
jgi:curved DNA-binding protein CbpA